MLFYPFLAMLSFKNITNRQLTMPCTISPAYRSTICTLSVQQITLEVQWMFAVVLVGTGSMRRIELGILAPPDAPPSTTGSSLSFQHIHHHYSIHISLPRTANVQIFVAIWTACPCQALLYKAWKSIASPCTKYINMLPVSQFLFSCHVRVKWQFTSYVSFKWRLDSARGLFLDQTDLFVNLR